MKTSLWKRVLCIATAILMLAAMTGCGDNGSVAEPSAESAAAPALNEAPSAAESSALESADLKAKWSGLAGKKLKVATSGVQAGWSQDDGNGGVEGMDIDVMNYIADYYGMEIEWTVADPTGIWGMLQSGEVDTIACVTTVNEDRLKAYWFTNTYAWESYSIVSRTEDGVPEAGDMSFWDGKTICTPAGSNPELILKDIIAEQAEQGVTINAVYPDSSAVLIQNVVSKETDAALMVTSTCAYKVRDLGYSDTLTIQDIQRKNLPIVYAWNRKDENKDIILAINDLIDEMQQDGTLSNFSNKWFEMDITQLPAGEVNHVTSTGDNAWQSYE